MPILDDSPLSDKVRYANLVLKSRPRDLEDTLAQLVHEDDPVVAAAAIHFVGQRRLWGLADDLEYVATHRSSDDRVVIEAASWALAAKHPALSGAGTIESLPIVELADRVRVISLFASLSVDELFRIAQAGEELRHPPAAICVTRERPPPTSCSCSREVQERSTEPRRAARSVPPAVIGFEDVLQGTALRSTVRALEPTVCFRIAADDFMTMVSDNVLLAQSLFGLLLAGDGPRVPFSPPPRTSPDRTAPGAATAARFLRQDPLLSRASAAQLLALTAVAPEVPLQSRRRALRRRHASGRLSDRPGRGTAGAPGHRNVTGAAGATIGVADTLAGTASGWRATVTRDGQALRLDRDELFAVLADHVDLMQGLFCGVLALRDAETKLAALS